MENKTVEMTKIVALQGAIELAKASQKVELAEKLGKMLATETKISSRKRGESKTTKAKKVNMEKVCQAFEGVEDFKTLSEIAVMIGLEEASSQKISAIMKPLVDNGTFEKGKEGKKVAYKLK